MGAHTSCIPTFKDIETAARRLNGHGVTTPLIESAELNSLIGGRVLIKPEMLQVSGSFKFRGAYNRISRMTEKERARGVVAYSSGNHGNGVAAAAASFGVAALIVMPSDAPAVKIEGVRAFGGEVHFYDRWTEDREAIAAGIARERDSVLIPPYDDFDVIAGQGTIGVEIVEQAYKLPATLDAVYCGASGGGLIAGIALSLEALSPKTSLYVVEPEAFDNHARSLQAGTRVPRIKSGATSICDSLMASMPGELTFGINGQRLEGAIAVTDMQVAEAVRYAFSKLKLVVEPGGAVSLAALLAGRIDARDKTVGIVLTGGNVDPTLFTSMLEDRL